MSSNKDMRQDSRVPRGSVSTWQPDRLRQVLTERGWTVGQLAATLGVSRNAIDGYLYNRGAPSPPALAHIAKALGVDTRDLAPMSSDPTLHELRWHTGLTIAEFAKEIGLSTGRAGIQLRAESSITAPEQWCEVLSVSPETLQRAWETTRRLSIPN